MTKRLFLLISCIFTPLSVDKMGKTVDNSGLMWITGQKRSKNKRLSFCRYPHIWGYLPILSHKFDAGDNSVDNVDNSCAASPLNVLKVHDDRAILTRRYGGS